MALRVEALRLGGLAGFQVQGFAGFKNASS